MNEERKRKGTRILDIAQVWMCGWLVAVAVTTNVGPFWARGFLVVMATYWTLSGGYRLVK